MPEQNVREKTKTGKLNKKELEFITGLRKNIEQDRSDMSVWQDKLVVATNQRLGLKRITNKPYTGAPNIPLPETDKQIRKKKPNFVMAVLGQKKPASVDFAYNVPDQTSPQMKEKRRKAEIGFNHILKTKMDIPRILSISVDNFLEKGMCFFKTIEEFKCESVQKTINLDDFQEEDLAAFKKLTKEEKIALVSDMTSLDVDDDDDKETLDDILKQYKDGETVIQYNELVYSSFPKILVPQPEDLFVPNHTIDICQAERITERVFLTKRLLLEGGINGVFDLSKVKQIVELAPTNKGTASDDSLNRQKDMNEGIANSINKELYELYIVSTWRQTGKDGRHERWVYTIVNGVADDNMAVIQRIRFPYEFDEWNYDKHDNEMKDWRFRSSRGVPEQIRALQEFMERAINNMLIRDDINNNPVFTILSNSRVKPNSNRFIPGQILRVKQHDEIKELGVGRARVDLSSNLILDKLKAFAEEYLASNDQLMRNATNAGGGKTLGEIDRGMQMNQNVLALDVLMWNETLKKVYRKVWKILRTRLGEPIIINGETITQADFDFDAEITPTGSVESLNKFEEIQKALMRVNMVLQQIKLGVICNEDDLYNVMEDYLEKDGIWNPERYITRPEVIAKARMESQQAQMQQQQALLQQAEKELMQEEQQVKAKAMAQGVNERTSE